MREKETKMVVFKAMYGAESLVESQSLINWSNEIM